MGQSNFLIKRFLLLIALITYVSTIHAQDPFQYILKNYFRIHPFEKRFSTFISQLRQDPWFTIESYETRTDSTFFFLSGTYKNFNPFHYSPTEVRLTLAEEQFIHTDSLQTLDTIINLQIMGITGTEAGNITAVNKEFKKVHNKLEGRFSQNNYSHIEKKGKVNGEIYNYFLFPFSISPVTIAWGPLPETNEYSFTITIRFKLKENMASLILAPGEY